MDNFSDDEKYEIQEILEQRKRKGVLEYLVRWKGTSEGNDSWEPAKTIAADCALAIQNFVAKSKASKAKRSTSRSRKTSRSRSRSSSRTRKSQSSTTVSKRQTRSRSRGRSQKTEETTTEEATKQTESSPSNSTITVQTTSNTSVESNSVEKKIESPENMSTQTHQRVMRSSTVEAKKELEVQRVHNEQRPVREDDSKPRSAIWKVADYAVIVMFALSLVAVLVLFLEKFVDLEGFKKQAFPNMTVLKKRLLSAQQGLVGVGQAGVDAVSDGWLYLLEQVKGGAAPAPTAQGAGSVPKQAPGA